ncbi:MAG: transcriptional initiation protein Tat [Microbacterium sp.]
MHPRATCERIEHHQGGDPYMNEALLKATDASSVARRTVVKGAAWSIPVIAAAAVVVPAHATSAATPEVESPLGDTITTWKGDHHYGSHEDDPERRSYDFPIVVTDGNGAPILGAQVTVVASGTNRDGDLLGVYAYPAPKNGGPESDPHRTATVTTNAQGRALFAVNTQNLSSAERPATATLTVTVTYNGVTTTKVITVIMSESD